MAPVFGARGGRRRCAPPGVLVPVLLSPGRLAPLREDHERSRIDHYFLPRSRRRTPSETTLIRLPQLLPLS